MYGIDKSIAILLGIVIYGGIVNIAQHYLLVPFNVFMSFLQPVSISQKVNNMASGAAVSAKELFEKYKKFVENNVETIGHLESAARILSYIVPGIVFCDALIYGGSPFRDSRTRDLMTLTQLKDDSGFVTLLT